MYAILHGAGVKTQMSYGNQNSRHDWLPMGKLLMMPLPVIGAWLTKLQKMPILSHMRRTVMKAVTSHPKDKYPFYLASFNQLIASCFP